MGYYVRFLPRKKNYPNWKVQFVSHKRVDQKATSQAQNPKRTWDIAPARWRALGFNSAMNIIEARARAKQLNANIKLKQQELRLRDFQEKQEKFQVRYEAALPEEFVS